MTQQRFFKQLSSIGKCSRIHNSKRRWIEENYPQNRAGKRDGNYINGAVCKNCRIGFNTQIKSAQSDKTIQDLK